MLQPTHIQEEMLVQNPTAVKSTIQEIAASTAKGHQVDIILLDFAKAFDKVLHTRLLHKLDHYGARGNVKRWILRGLPQPQRTASDPS